MTRKNYYTGMPPMNPRGPDLKRRAAKHERRELDHEASAHVRALLANTLKRIALDVTDAGVKAAYEIVLADMEDS